MLAFRLGEAFDDRQLDRWGKLATFTMAVLVLVVSVLPLALFFRRAILLIGVAITLPFVFRMMKDLTWDRKIGDYSYSLYISHFLSIAVVYLFVVPLVGEAFWKISALVVIMIVTWALRHCIEKPLEPIRNKLRQGQWPW